MKKNILIKITSLLLFFIVSSNNIKAQKSPDSLLLDFAAKFPQEKIYVQFDRPYYNPGETIWFKAYLTSNMLPSDISKTIYADLIDENGKLLQRKIMPAKIASAASCFNLPDSIHSSIVYVRAYTAWMLNFDSSLIYIKPLHIITGEAKKIKQPKVLYDIQFFPEGGDLVENLSSRVAFKATNQYGMPVNVKGNIVDDKNNPVTTFSSIHDGMGVFNLTPLPGKNYKATWKDKAGILHENNLPDAKNIGATLSANNTDSFTNFTITRTDNADDSYKFYYIVAQMEGQPTYSARINMTQKTVVDASIPTGNFPDGVMQLTVFNKNRVPVAERIVFINHGNYYFNTDLHIAEKNITKRGRNSLQIDIGGTFVSNLSIAVTDADLNTLSGNDENIYSSLLLSSNLKGYIYNPAYYFSSDDDSVKQHLDLVMMTNGWRRFKWIDLLQNQWPVIKYQPEQSISIKGKVFGLSKNQLYNKDLTAMLQTKNAGIQTLSIPITKDGDFIQPNLYFFDTAKVYYQLNNDKDKSLTSMASFSFRNDFVSPPKTDSLFSSYNPLVPDSIIGKKNATNSKLLHQSSKNGGIRTLEEVKVTTRVKSAEEKMNDEYTSGLFSSSDAHVFIIEDNALANGSLNVINYLQGKVAGLSISMGGGEGASATWRGSATSFFLDEMPVDINAIQQVEISNIAMVKVFPPPFIGGTGGSPGGAIAIDTKKGAARNAAIKGLDNTSVTGYSVVKEFYSPNYDTNNDPTINDLRTTLYWNPYIILDDKKRRVTLPFYNSDKCKRIKVIIEGINENGQLTREEKIFE